MGPGPYSPADAPDAPQAADAEGARLESFRVRLQVFAARRVHDWTAAEDIAQETLRRGLEALRAGRIRNPDALGGYLFQTALRLCIHRGRSAGRERKALQRLGPTSETSTDDGPLRHLISGEDRSRLLAALGTLSPDDRSLLELTYRDELDSAEIGRRLGLSAGAVCVRRHRAIRKLARLLAVRKGPDRDLDV
jgi:RNA polymerase sigma-70 factor (ECF subfamily)